MGYLRVDVDAGSGGFVCGIRRSSGKVLCSGGRGALAPQAGRNGFGGQRFPPSGRLCLWPDFVRISSRIRIVALLCPERFSVLSIQYRNIWDMSIQNIKFGNMYLQIRAAMLYWPQCAVCSVQCAVCSVQCAVCSAKARQNPSAAGRGETWGGQSGKGEPCSRDMCR